MNLFYTILVILLILFIPIPIKFNIYYSIKNYYVKLYGLTIIRKTTVDFKKKRSNIINISKKKEHNFFSKFYNNINYKSLISNLYNTKFKPLLNFKFYLDYSLIDAARTAIFYGVLYQIPPIIYLLINTLFKTNNFSFKINPIFEDKFLVKIEISSIIFISFANIIYILFILFKNINEQRR